MEYIRNLGFEDKIILLFLEKPSNFEFFHKNIETIKKMRNFIDFKRVSQILTGAAGGSLALGWVYKILNIPTISDLLEQDSSITNLLISNCYSTRANFLELFSAIIGDLHNTMEIPDYVD